MWRSAVQLRAGLLVEKYETAVETRVFRFFYDFGGIAQLVEHNICNVGVAGSNPTISTKIAGQIGLLFSWRTFSNPLSPARHPPGQGECRFRLSPPSGGYAASMLRISLTLHRAPDGASLRSYSSHPPSAIRLHQSECFCVFQLFFRYLRNAKPQSPWIIRKSM